MNLSDRPELNELSKTLLPVARRASELKIEWLIIGAAGRDLIFEYGYGLPATRATFDVDVAIQVKSWEDYQRLRSRLTELDGARDDPNQKQRLHFSGQLSLDLVPFGEIEDDGKVRWPPANDPVLSVRGLEDAFRASRPFILPGQIEVRVPTVQNYFCLKLFAWSSRHDRKPHHDSVDLAHVLSNAGELIPIEELYDQHESTLASNDHDHSATVLQILGERLKHSARAETIADLTTILKPELDEEGRLDLVRELGPGRMWIHLLAAFLRGLR